MIVTVTQRALRLAAATACWASLTRVGAQTETQAANANAPEDVGDRSTAFVAVTGPVREDVPGGKLLVGAYVVAFAALALYVLMLLEKQRRINASIAELVAKQNKST